MAMNDTMYLFRPLSTRIVVISWPRLASGPELLSSYNNGFYSHNKCSFSYKNHIKLTKEKDTANIPMKELLQKDV